MNATNKHRPSDADMISQRSIFMMKRVIFPFVPINLHSTVYLSKELFKQIKARNSKAKLFSREFI